MKIYRLIGTLLDYPDDEMLAELRQAVASEGVAALIADLDPDDIFGSAEHATIAAFIDTLLRTEPLDAQAAYVQNFDLTAEHSLHLTHHLFGEEKTRGPALIDLREFYQSHGLSVDEKELPDYLPVMLEFVSELSIEEGIIFLGDVAKVLKVLADNLEKSGSPYAPLIRLIEGQASLTRLVA